MNKSSIYLEWSILLIKKFRHCSFYTLTLVNTAYMYVRWKTLQDCITLYGCYINPCCLKRPLLLLLCVFLLDLVGVFAFLIVFCIFFICKMSGAEYFTASFWPLDDLISVNKKRARSIWVQISWLSEGRSVRTSTTFRFQPHLVVNFL